MQIYTSQRITEYLGIWKLSDWSIQQASTQLSGRVGVYCLKNKINNKVLIGEGKLGGHASRILRHIRGFSNNSKWLSDLTKYGNSNFYLDWIILENEEVKRKIFEHELQIIFKEKCYNTPRRPYPKQKQLLVNASKLNNYNVERLNFHTPCWVSNLSKCEAGYARIREGKDTYLHHVLMYILYNGDICSVSSVIHHKCNNKSCVNPDHLEATTNIGNSQLYYNNTIKAFKSKLKGISYSKRHKSYRCIIYFNGKNLDLGFYNDDIHGAQNRDFFIVKNKLWDKPKSTLNFHNIDYNSFQPYPTISNKVHHNLLTCYT